MDAEADYTIDELARAANVTVRSVRVYHERGVLPPPQVRGRTGYYGAEHLERLRTIGRLLDRGMKLNGIKELFDAWDRGEGLTDVLGLVGAGARRVDRMPVETVSAADLESWCREAPDGLARVLALGLFERVDERTYRVLNPRLHRIGVRLIGAGVAIPELITELEALQADSARIARRHADLLRRVAAADDHAPASAALTQSFAELVTEAVCYAASRQLATPTAANP
jgi:DNA-binding transcriptional MerR regulator